MTTRTIKVMNTAFRDGFQSVYGARVFTKDFLPAVQACREAGMRHFEAGGGARFQSLFFYCNENAFDMMDAFREAAGPDANLQTLARGVNVVGLDSQPSDVIRAHAQLFAKHGMTTIRNFDALNDVENLVFSGRCIVEAGLKHEVVVSMMELPPGCSGAHTAEFYEQTLRRILDADIPFDSVCFKDASGTAVPSKVHETILRARKLLGDDVDLVFHTHETAGISILGYKAAIDAGANRIDLSIAPCSGGTCQPDVITMWHALRGTGVELDVDIDKVRVAEAVFKDCMKDYMLPPEATAVEPIIPWSPMPGGALTANTQMLRDNGIMDRYPEIIAAMGEVVRRGGFGTSVTPVSQFYFQQAFNNTMFGPWERIAEGYGKMVLGYFGKTPVPADPEIVKIAAAKMGLEPTTRPVLELNDADPKKGLKPARQALLDNGIEPSDENVFIAATCKQKGIDYLLGKATVGVRKVAAEQPAAAATHAAAHAAAHAPASDTLTVIVNGREHTVRLTNGKAEVDGRSFDIDVRDGTPAAPPPARKGSGEPVVVQMPGKVMRMLARSGQRVTEGQALLILEAMKMEMEIKAPCAGVFEPRVQPGDQVPAGRALGHIA